MGDLRDGLPSLDYSARRRLSTLNHWCASGEVDALRLIPNQVKKYSSAAGTGEMFAETGLVCNQLNPHILCDCMGCGFCFIVKRMGQNG